MTNAISPTRVASTMGTLVSFKNLAPGGFGLQQRVAVLAQGSTASTFPTTKLQIFSALEAASVYGFGSQIHMMAAQLFPSGGDGVGDIPVTVYPLLDGTTEATGDITPAGTTTAAGTYFVRIAGIDTASFALASGAVVADAVAAIVAAVSAKIDIPVTAVDAASLSADFTCKWKGLTGNDITISVHGPSVGMTFGVTAMASGAGDPLIDAAVTSQFGSVWETCILNGLGGTAAALDALALFDEGLWLPQESRPFLGAFYATTEATLATAITVPDARKTDRTNSQLSAPGSVFTPWAIAARKVARIAKQANSTSPATDYIGLIASGITPGADSVQWTSAQRDTAVKAGASTSQSRDGVLQLDDTVTFYHPPGDPTPAYRYVRDKNKLLQMLNDIKLEFDTPKWKAPPLIPDNQTTTDRTAKQPKMARAALSRLTDSWGLKALISDPATAKTTIFADINGSNPNRLDLAETVQFSGNAGIISMDLNFGFFFGGATA